MFVNDPALGGYLPLQHREYSKEGGLPLEGRHVMYAVRLLPREFISDEVSPYVVEPGSAGDVIGWVLWPNNPDKRAIPAWAAAWPAITIGGPEFSKIGSLIISSCLPVTVDTKGWKTDKRFNTLDASLPPGFTSVPVGTPGIVLAATNDLFQEEVFCPVGLGNLIAVNRNGSPGMASVVYDLTDKDELDLERGARLHSAWRVFRSAVRPCVKFASDLNYLAWQLGRAGRDDLEGLGLTCDLQHGVLSPPETALPSRPVGMVRVFGSSPVTGAFGEALVDVNTAVAGGLLGNLRGQTHITDIQGRTYKIIKYPDGTPIGVEAVSDGSEDKTVAQFKTGAPAALATAGVRGGGPLHVGGPDCQHELSRTLDGEIIRSLHLATSSLFRGGIGDAPLEFTNRLYSNPQPRPFRTRAWIVWDPDIKHNWVCGPRDGMWRLEAEGFFTTSNPTYRTRKVPRNWNANRKDSPPDRTCDSSMLLGVPGVTFRSPRPVNSTDFDLRSSIDPDPEMVDRWLTNSPIVVRMETFRKEINKDPSYTERPNTGRYVSGTSQGSIWFMPPERDIANAENGWALPSGITESLCGVYAAPNTFTGWGVPDTTTGRMKTGHQISVDGSGLTTCEQVTSAGARTAIYELDDEFCFKRSQCVPIISVGSGTTTLSTAHHSVLCDTSGGNVTIALPASTGAQGRVYSITRITGGINSCTIDPNGAELINGAATKTLTTQFESATIHCDGTQWFIVGIGAA